MCLPEIPITFHDFFHIVLSLAPALQHYMNLTQAVQYNHSLMCLPLRSCTQWLVRRQAQTQIESVIPGSQQPSSHKPAPLTLRWLLPPFTRSHLYFKYSPSVQGPLIMQALAELKARWWDASGTRLIGLISHPPIAHAPNFKLALYITK